MLQSDIKITALYCRLSQEDLHAGENQSESIQNQKNVLQKYAQEHHFLNTRFFIDDGVSGVSFEREGLQSMLREVEAGNVSTVITKDLSRLGRNYLKTGELIEITFPENNVRYIAINDGVDTAKEDNEFTPLRNWFNEFYARDTSKKIRSIIQSKAQRGERVNGSVPYGYLIDKEDKNHLIPDPETASVVKEIFIQYAGGKRICDIQKWLSENQVLNVTALRYWRRHGSHNPKVSLEKRFFWSGKTLYDILARKEYLGHTVTRKSQKLSYKSRKTRQIPEEERCLFPNTHEAIIHEEIFTLVQTRLDRRSQPTKTNEIDLFSGLLFCGDCGHKMHLQRDTKKGESKFAYTCGRYRNQLHTRDGIRCTCHHIKRDLVKDFVLKDLQRVVEYVRTCRNDFLHTAEVQMQKEAEKSVRATKREYDGAIRRMEELKILFRRLYEDHTFGKISDEQFSFLSSSYEEEQKTLAEKIKTVGQTIQSVKDQRADARRFLEIVDKYTDITELNYELLHDFIDRVLIYEADKATKTRKIEIFYNFVGQVQEIKE